MEEKKALIFNIQKFSIHDGPGLRTAVFYKGCPLNCLWCSNPESQNFKPENIWDKTLEKQVLVGEYKTVEEIMVEVRKDLDFYLESGGGVTVTGGEVLIQIDQVVALLKQCKKEGIHTATETSGYSTPKNFKKLIDNVDLLMMDIKHHDTVKHKEKTGVPLEPILKNLDIAVSEKEEMLIRVPVIPNFNDSEEDAHKFGQLFKGHKVESIELLPFHQFGEEKYNNLNLDYAYADVKQMHSDDLIEYAKIIEEYGVNCKIG